MQFLESVIELFARQTCLLMFSELDFYSQNIVYRTLWPWRASSATNQINGRFDGFIYLTNIFIIITITVLFPQCISSISVILLGIHWNGTLRIVPPLVVCIWMWNQEHAISLLFNMLLYGKHVFFTECCLDLPHPCFSLWRDDGESEGVAQWCRHITARTHLTKLQFA